MTTALTQTALSDAVKTQYERRLLIRAVPRLVHGRWARKATINKFGSYELRRYEALTAVTTALTEASTPSEETAMTLTLVTLTPLFYGAWIGFSDELELTIYDPLVSEVSGVLGEQAGLSADTLIRNEITDAATSDFSNDVASRAALDAPDDNITYLDFSKALATLMAANALPIDGGRYICIVHPHTYWTLYNDPVFVNLFTEEVDPMRSGFMGRFLNCDIYVTSNAREYADGGTSTTDVYSCLFLGAESYGCCGLPGINPRDVDPAGPDGPPMTGAGMRAAPVEIIAKQLGSAGADDPLNQRATLGWKMGFDTEELNAAFMVDLEHTTIFSDD